MKRISIALAADHRYLPGLLATLASMILSSTSKIDLCFHIFADGLSEDDQCQVKQLAERLGLPLDGLVFHHPDMTRIQNLFKPYKGSHAAFLRLFLCEFLSDDWVVYADVDTLWFRDICELWKQRDETVSVLWCRDLPSIAQGVKQYVREYCPDLDVNRYACSGVMLMNLKRMRENRFVDKCVAFANRWGTPPFVDQDILNVVCLHDARLLDQRWNCMNPVREAREGCVLHFNGIGQMFNRPFAGWRVLYYMWYRFYYDVVEQDRSRAVCSRLKYSIFRLLGSFYPNDLICRALSIGHGCHTLDCFRRYFFFAWLERHASWMRNW